jgi:hypothetical protein
LLAGCELLVGIKDKTESSDASDGTEDPSVACSQQPSGFLFCDDFDTETEAGATWQWDIPNNGGLVKLDSMRSKTPPNSVQITMPAGTAQAQLGRDIQSLSNGYRLAFDLYVDMSDLSSIPQVGLAQAYRSTGATFSVNYILGPGATCEAQIYEGSSNSPAQVLPLDLPPLQTWTRIVLVYDAVQGVSILEDGKTLATSPSVAQQGAPGDTSIIVGGVYSNPPGATPLVVEIDDVVMRGQ